MPISNLQLGLIVAGVVLVLGVLIYNAWQERRVRRRIESAFRATETIQPTRVEPTLKATEDAEGGVPMRSGRATPAHAAAASRAPDSADSAFVPPMDVIEHDDTPVASRNAASTATTVREPLPVGVDTRYSGVQPDPDIESIL